MHTKFFLVHSSACSDAAATPKVSSRNALRLRIRLQGGRNLYIHFPKLHLCLVAEGFVPLGRHTLSMAQIRRGIATKYAMGFKDGEVTNG